MAPADHGNGRAREPMMQSVEVQDLADALASAQGEMPVIRKTKTAQVYSQRTGKTFTYRYADLGDIFEGIRPVLSKNGLAITQVTYYNNSQRQHVLQTKLLHNSGQWLASNFPLNISDSPQQTGSALTYYRRYALTAILGIAAEEDDDAQAAEDKPDRNPVPQQKKPPKQEGARLNPQTLEITAPTVKQWIDAYREALKVAKTATDIVELEEANKPHWARLEEHHANAAKKLRDDCIKRVGELDPLGGG